MTNRQQKALVALIRAPTIEAAAETAGVGYSTMRKWLKDDPEFKAAYQAEMGALLEDASAQSKKSLSTALSVLTQVMKESENSQARIAAARATIEYTLRLNEAADVERRLAALERRPQSMIPRFTIEYADGHRENFIGTDIISHHDGIRRITFDGQHQPSVDAAALYRMLHDDVEIVEQ